MISLSLHGRPVRTVFDLRGHSEASATAALGFVMSRCGKFTQAVLGRVVGELDVEAAQIALEVREDGLGRTDVEVVAPELHVIIEAKVGWQVPTHSQMELYARRLHGTTARRCAVVALSNTAQASASAILPRRILGIDIGHLEWRSLLSIAQVNARRSRGAERRLLKDFGIYLENTVMSASKPADFAYVVALGAGRSERWNIGWIDAVTKERKYFHPIGHGYPKEPPAYMGFRYDGRLQSVHRVLKSDVVTRASHGVRGASKLRIEPHFVHHLGPPFMVEREIRSGPMRNRRAWCRLDDLFTAKTVDAAARRSSKHLKKLDG